MKKTILSDAFAVCLLALSVLLGSCSHSSVEETKEKRLVEFNVVNYEQILLDDVTRAEALPHLVLGVYDKAGKLVQEISQEAGEADYGKFAVELEGGTYEFLFLGYDRDSKADLTDLTSVSFAGRYVPNVYYCYLKMDVTQATEAAKPIMLSRCIARFDVRITDALPLNFALAKVDIDGVGETFNARTGLAGDTQGRHKEFQIEDPQSLKLPLSLITRCFLPAESFETKVAASAFTSQGELLVRHELQNVPLKINQLTRYTGTFFPQDGASFEVGMPESQDWNEIVDRPL